MGTRLYKQAQFWETKKREINDWKDIVQSATAARDSFPGPRDPTPLRPDPGDGAHQSSSAGMSETASLDFPALVENAQQIRTDADLMTSLVASSVVKRSLVKVRGAVMNSLNVTKGYLDLVVTSTGIDQGPIAMDPIKTAARDTGRSWKKSGLWLICVRKALDLFSIPLQSPPKLDLGT